MTRPDHILAVLRRHPDLVRVAAGSFDFDLDRAEHVEEVRLASGALLRAVAGDDTGGTYFVCADGAVLYASSEGEAGLIGASMDEALEILFGLPGWHDYTELDLAADEEVLEAVFNRTEDEIRDSYGPELDADRSMLLSGLGLREHSRRELLRRLQESLLRTEPEFLLVNADEGCAYALLDRLRRPPLWQAVLAPGRADLARMRADRDCWDAIAGDPVRRPPSCAQPSTTGSRPTCSFCAYSCDRKSAAAPPKSSASPRSWSPCTVRRRTTLCCGLCGSPTPMSTSCSAVSPIPHGPSPGGRPTGMSRTMARIPMTNTTSPGRRWPAARGRPSWPAPRSYASSMTQARVMGSCSGLSPTSSKPWGISGRRSGRAACTRPCRTTPTSAARPWSTSPLCNAATARSRQPGSPFNGRSRYLTARRHRRLPISWRSILIYRNRPVRSSLGASSAWG